MCVAESIFTSIVGGEALDELPVLQPWRKTTSIDVSAPSLHLHAVVTSRISVRQLAAAVQSAL
jgi:hypothetical protein